MRYVCPAAVAALAIITGSAWGQPQALSIANYQLTGTQLITPTMSRFTYRADVVNTGGALGTVSATVTSVDPFSIRVIPGLDTLQFSNVPAGGQVTSSNTFTILANSAMVLDASKLQWSFQFSAPTGGGPVANAGPNQTLPPGSTVILNGSGSTNPAGGGALTYSWEFLSRPAGSGAYLLHSSTMLASFIIDVPGLYVVTLTVSNGAASSSSNVTISTASTPPVANAGPNQTVAVGSTVMLNGSGSTSSSGNPLTYAWTLTSRPPGSLAALSGAVNISPSFMADQPGTYTASLVVNDKLASSAPATVTITTQVVKPVANAGPAQMVSVNSLVQLNGSGSTDANKLPLTYQWTLLNVPAGSAAALSNAAIVNPTFTADRPGNYVAQLIVNNGTLSSDASTVVITTTQGTLAPTANAGTNQTVPVNGMVLLSGSGTDPQNLPLTYQWLLVTKPAGSSANLSSTVIQSPVFVADLAGSYVAQLTVTNGILSSAPSTVTITTSCAQPVANAGTDQTVAAGSTVNLNGTGSSDVCHGALTYAWSFTTRPAGSNATLPVGSTATPSFVADVAGAYVAQLIVNNGFTSSNPATVMITASAGGPPPSGGGDILLPANVTVPPGQNAQFQVTLTRPAPGGGVFIALSTSDPSKATIAPAFIIIQQGNVIPSRPPVVTGVNAGSATITATAFGLNPTSQLLQVGTPPATAMNFSPATLTIPANTTQNLTLNLTPPPGGTIAVTLNSSNGGVIAVTPSINVVANTTTVSIPVTSAGAGTATITASAPGYPAASAIVTANAVQAGAIGVPASSSVGLGLSAAFPVSLSVPAPVGGITVTLISSDSSKVGIPGSVFIGGGATTPLVQPQITGNGAGAATITASAAGYTSGVSQIQVTGGVVSGSSSFSPAAVTINAGSSQNLTLNLSGPAPAGLTASLISSNPNAAMVPSSVGFSTGAMSATVPVTGMIAGAATITAAVSNFGSASANVTVQAVAASGIVLPANVNVALGDSVPFPVTLAASAPDGVFITLASSDTSKLTIAPANIFIRGGATAPSSPPKITGVGAGTASITASASGFAPVSQNVQVGSAASLGLSPGTLSLTQNATQNLTLTLPSPAPLGGVAITISSSNPGVASVSSSATVSSYGSSVNIPVTGVAAGGTTITASAAGFTSATANVNVSGAASIILPPSIALAPGASANFPVSLGAAAPVGGITVNLVTSDASKVSISPSAVFFPQGATASATVPIVTGIGFGAATITASAAGIGSASQQVAVTSSSGFQPASAVIQGIGAMQQFTLVLSAPAPAGLVLNVSSSDPSVAAVPASIAVPASATSVNVPVTSVGPGSAYIQASALPVFPAAVATVRVVSSQSIILPGFDAVGIQNVIDFPVSLSSPAPSGGVTVTLTSSDTTKFTITPSVYIPGGALTPAVQPRITSGDTALNEGFSTVTATAPGYTSSSLEMHIYDAVTIGVPYNLSVGLGQSVPLPVALPGPAPAGGVTLTITSTNPAVAIVTPTAFVPAGSNFPVTLPLMTGTGFGSATIDVSGPGYISGAQHLQVTGSMRFSPLNPVLVGNGTQNITLVLSGPAPPSGLSVSLGSNNTAVAALPATVFFPAGATSVNIPVSGAGSGAAFISAGFTDFPNVPGASTTLTRQ